MVVEGGVDIHSRILFIFLVISFISYDCVLICLLPACLSVELCSAFWRINVFIWTNFFSGGNGAEPLLPEKCLDSTQEAVLT